MSYFNKDYTKYFRDLEKNNNKEWFAENKDRYKKSVREPMIAFVEDLIQAMQKYDKEFNPVAAKCLSRINRDIRFSKDKTPYNTHMHAHITKGTKESPLPGIAFRLGANDAGIMAGYYMPSKEKLLSIRTKIANNLKGFQKLKENKKFVEKFKTIQGEALKRIPKQFQETYEKEPLIANKQFYYVAHKKASFTQSENILEEIMECWHAAKPLNDFFSY